MVMLQLFMFLCQLCRPLLAATAKRKTINKKQEMLGMRKLRFTLHWRHGAKMRNMFCDYSQGKSWLDHLQNILNHWLLSHYFTINKVLPTIVILLLTLTTRLSLPSTHLTKQQWEQSIRASYRANRALYQWWLWHHQHFIAETENSSDIFACLSRYRQPQKSSLKMKMKHSLTFPFPYTLTSGRIVADNPS